MADETGADDIAIHTGGSGRASKAALKHAAFIIPRMIHMLQSELDITFSDIMSVELGQGLGPLESKAELYPEGWLDEGRVHRNYR